MEQDIAIRVHDVSKVYKMYNKPTDRLKEALNPFKKRYAKDFYALDKISLEVKKGETVGIIGRNGSGKSTLLKIITGVLQPTSGQVEVHGRISALLELGTGFNMELTGIDNIYFSGAINGYTKDEMNCKIDDILAFADIGDFVYQPVKTYSSGMFVRLAFAVSIHVQPDVFIVDEALSVGDAQFQKKCLKEFYRLRDSGCSILFVSHETYAVRNICQRALYLQQGKAISFGASSEVVDRYIYDIEANEVLDEEDCLLGADEQASVGQAQQGDSGEQGEDAVIDGSYIEKQAVSQVRIEQVWLLNKLGEEVQQIYSGEDLVLKFNYKIIGQVPTKLSFVFNLYRHNGFYVCGTTTLMDKIEAIEPKPQGSVTITFPRIALLAGKYKIRVAINDDGGLGIYAEANPACEFKVMDKFEAVGLVNLPRQWKLE